MEAIGTAQLTTALRQLLLFAGGFAVAKGWISNDNLQIIVPALLTVAVAAYGIWKRRPAGIIKSAADLPDVHAVITNQTAANAVPLANVVGTLNEASRLPGVR